MTAAQRCHVYKSLRRADAYVYLAERDGFAVLPNSVRAQLEPLAFVLELDLSTPRKLGREDFATVRSNVQHSGFHVQLPPPVLVQFGATIAND